MADNINEDNQNGNSENDPYENSEENQNTISEDNQNGNIEIKVEETLIEIEEYAPDTRNIYQGIKDIKSETQLPQKKDNKEHIIKNISKRKKIKKGKSSEKFKENTTTVPMMACEVSLEALSCRAIEIYQNKENLPKDNPLKTERRKYRKRTKKVKMSEEYILQNFPGTLRRSARIREKQIKADAMRNIITAQHNSTNESNSLNSARGGNSTLAGSSTSIGNSTFQNSTPIVSTIFSERNSITAQHYSTNESNSLNSERGGTSTFAGSSTSIENSTFQNSTPNVSTILSERNIITAQHSSTNESNSLNSERGGSSTSIENSTSNVSTIFSETKKKKVMKNSQAIRKRKGKLRKSTFMQTYLNEAPTSFERFVFKNGRKFFGFRWTGHKKILDVPMEKLTDPMKILLKDALKLTLTHVENPLYFHKKSRSVDNTSENSQEITSEENSTNASNIERFGFDKTMRAILNYRKLQNQRQSEYNGANVDVDVKFNVE